MEKKVSPLAQAVHHLAGVDISKCYQCGKCTAGCPMAPYMDIAPNRMMYLVQVGDTPAADLVLNSGAIWTCAGCLTCTQRCPQKVDVAGVIDALRETAHQAGKISPERKKVLAFHQAFLDGVAKNGVMNEMPLVRQYKLATKDLFSDVTLAPKMMLKGKLKMFSRKIKGRHEVARIFERCRKAGKP